MYNEKFRNEALNIQEEKRAIELDEQQRERRRERARIERRKRRASEKADPVLSPFSFSPEPSEVRIRNLQRKAAVPKDTRTPIQIILGDPMPHQQVWRKDVWAGAK